MRKFLPDVPCVQALGLENRSVGGFVCEKEFISYMNKSEKLFNLSKTQDLLGP